MKTLQGATALAAAALLALTLAGCTTGGTSTDTGTDTGTESGDTDSNAPSTDDAEFVGVTLPGTGDYTVPDQAPIGGYELPENQDGLPDGCTWTLYDGNGSVLGDGETNGQFVFLTDVVARFVTDGCPDWVQFED